MKARTSQAAALHRRAVATSLAAAAALETSTAAHADEREQRALAERLRTAAAELVPGWLGTPLDELPPAYPVGAATPTGAPTPPRFLRVGTARPLDDARFPAVVPLLGTGHLSIDVDGRDARVAGLLRAVLLRLLAAAPTGSLLVRAVDATGAVFAPFLPLAAAGLVAPPATDAAGLATLLAEAEQWVRPARPTATVRPTATARAARPAATVRPRHERSLLLVVAALPESTGEADLARLDALAQHGPEAGLHLVVAGWPPAPSSAGATRPPLPRATTVALRERYALLGDPPGVSFGIPLPYLPSTGLNSPVLVDGDPPANLLDRACRDLADRAAGGTAAPVLGELLAEPAQPPPGGPGVPGLITVVGYDGATRVTLGFTDLTPHWLVAGRAESGKTSFLATVLLGLGTRHGPHELELWLVSLAAGGSFSQLLPAGPAGGRLPQVRIRHDGCGPERALAVLRDLDAERERRVAVLSAAGVRRLAELPEHRRPPRILCVVDEFQEVLLATGAVPPNGARSGPSAGPPNGARSGPPAEARTEARTETRAEALDLLERLGRAGRTLGVHLLLASRPSVDATRPDRRRDAVLGQFPVRVALPGGDQVLQPDNDSAAGLPLGAAVINTAGGLGGPRGATRGHERVVRFPDAYADPAALVAVRDRIQQRYAGRTATVS